MTAPTFSPEVIAGAKDMCAKLNVTPWADMDDHDRQFYCQAFSAGLRAMLPVSDELAEISAKAATPLATGQSSLLSRAKARAAILAAINHITSGSAA